MDTQLLVPDTPRRAEQRQEQQTKQVKKPLRTKDTVISSVLQPSSFLSNLTTLNETAPDVAKQPAVQRSLSFAQTPPKDVVPSIQRDESMAIVEDLQPGPYDHRPPLDDPNFDHLEPHSGINLATRSLAHADLCEMLRGRYYISPSTLYSVVRLQASRQGYDVPVVGDWVTIAVVAERGPVKLTVSPGGGSREEEEDAPTKTGKRDPKDAKKDSKAKDNAKKRPPGKKFLSLKLVDFGARSSQSSNAQKTIRGDALLTLLLFEADSHSISTTHDGTTSKVYRGGSRGAFESCARLREGSVLALLNPRILKPLAATSDRPHRTQNVLAISPESAESVVVLGHARDLGTCGAVKKDGKPCGAWLDKRLSQVCEYHVHTAVQSRRASRPEFTAGTSGMSTRPGGPAKSKASAYDPQRKWGLAPEPAAPGGETYVLAGHVVSGRAAVYEPTAERLGREREARLKRKRERVAGDAALADLLGRERARGGAGEETLSLALKALGRTKKSAEDEPAADGDARRRVFSAEAIKRIGFDPLAGTKKGSAAARKDLAADAKRKLDVLGEKSVGAVELGARPGKRVRSGIRVPEGERDLLDALERTKTDDCEVDMDIPAGTDSDDDLYVEPANAQKARTADNHDLARPTFPDEITRDDGVGDIEPTATGFDPTSEGMMDLLPAQLGDRAHDVDLHDGRASCSLRSAALPQVLPTASLEDSNDDLVIE